MNAIKNTSAGTDVEFVPLADTKNEFYEWLVEGHAKKYNPDACISCLNEISDYTIKKKAYGITVWSITNRWLFDDFFKKLSSDKMFRVTSKKTHQMFLKVGVLYSQFLREYKKEARQESTGTISELFADKSDPSDLHISSKENENTGKKFTIVEAAVEVLNRAKEPLTMQAIFNAIISDRLYVFNSKNPLRILYTEVRRHCEGVKLPKYINAHKVFRIAGQNGGKSLYSTVDSDKIDEIDCDGRASSFVWSEPIATSFQDWMIKQGKAIATARGYCSAVRNIIAKFPVKYEESQKETNAHDGVGKFAKLLEVDANYQELNKASHNQYSAALKAFTQFMGVLEQPCSEKPTTTLSKDETIILNIFKDEFPNGMRLGFVDLSKLKTSYGAKMGHSITWTDKAINDFIRKNGIKIGGNSERYAYLYSLVDESALTAIETFIDGEFCKGRQRVYAERIFDLFHNRINIAVDAVILLTIIGTVFYNKYKIDRRSCFVALLSADFTASVSDEIHNAIVELLHCEIMPFSADDIKIKYPGYPTGRIDNILSGGSELIISLPDKKFAHVEFVYISDDELFSIQQMITDDINEIGYSLSDELYDRILSDLPDVIGNNEDVSKNDLLKALKYRLRGVFDTNRNIRFDHFMPLAEGVE